MTETTDNQPLTELIDDWYDEWGDLSADIRQELVDDLEVCPFVIG